MSTLKYLQKSSIIDVWQVLNAPPKRSANQQIHIESWGLHKIGKKGVEGEIFYKKGGVWQKIKDPKKSGVSDFLDECNAPTPHVDISAKILLF